MKHTSKLLTALLLTMAFLVSALPVHGIHAEPETATVQKKAELVFVIDSTGSMSGAIKNVKTGITSFVNSLETQGVNLRIRASSSSAIVTQFLLIPLISK